MARQVGHQQTCTAAEAIRFRAAVRANPYNAALLDRLPALGLPDCWLVAGCLFETIWNVQTRAPPTAQIDDYDIFYFDDGDLSYEAEDLVIMRVLAAFGDLPVKIEVRNQARVHLWYQHKFGREYPKLTSSCDGIDRFLVAGTCIGVRCMAGAEPDVYAPYGLADMYAGILTPNVYNHNEGLFAPKAAKYCARWPWLRVVEASGGA